MSDHFSTVAEAYAQSRPTYPKGLFLWLAQVAPARELVWDAGCGNGQASLALSEHFHKVLATDLSADQIARAPQRDNITYRVATCLSGLADSSADLVTVAQALHWFDLDAFYAEVRRVLKPNGVIAVWTYGVFEIDGAPAIAAEVSRLYEDVVGPYWPPERVYPETGYASLAFPFETLATPAFVMTAQWDMAQLLGYFRSWSATVRMEKATGVNPIDAFTPVLAKVWGDSAKRHALRWPLSVKVGTLKTGRP
ncbi:class I SAM-dependent methyltransferase [Asticcacaulis sp. AC402]|uniref:class I SAM-dependent methyltransferase n=1 Tax=Asticcacaulis sp. AC402 TaxID=1282361 RepID=UPI0003C40DB2|nr:class I SAM-dependent methyltransferase [Asticcacaulis sp. AC402]ESQ76828.1 hypothetical protein ABAC402_03970 [Asticcacaulis sp. AC402]